MTNSFYLRLMKNILRKKTLPLTQPISKRKIVPRHRKRKKSQHLKRRGRKSEIEREQWLKDKQPEEEARPIYEKKIVHQLTESVERLYAEAPIDPKWGIKKNSYGKNISLFGYKAHLAVSMKSQYILAGMMTSGNLNDGKVAIPLLKKIERNLPNIFTARLLDAGYDYEATYQQLMEQNLQAVIPYNRRTDLYLGTCLSLCQFRPEIQDAEIYASLGM